MEEGIVKDLLDDAAERMRKSVEATTHEFTTVRTGRASPHLDRKSTRLNSSH